MCIRDSQQRGPARTDAQTDEKEAEGGERHSGHRVGAHRGCLLYTSDAADERSSVDLGGRRIIKKKKKSEREERYIREKISGI